MTAEEFDDLRLVLNVARATQAPNLKALRRELLKTGLERSAIDKAITLWSETLLRQGPP